MSVAWVGAAVAAVGVVSQQDSARRASNQQKDAANAAIEAQKDSEAAALELQRPRIEAGNKADNRLLELLGLGGDPNASGYGSLNTPFSFTPGDLTATPGYQFQLQQGQEALDRKAAAGGGFYSGANLKAAAGFNQDLAGTTFDNEYNRAFNAYQTNRANTLNPLQALADRGQSAANTASNINVGAGNALSNIYTGLGNAQGAATIAQGNALTSGLQNGLSAWQQATYLNKLQQQPYGYGANGSQGYFTQWGNGGGFGSGTGGMGD